MCLIVWEDDVINAPEQVKTEIESFVQNLEASN